MSVCGCGATRANTATTRPRSAIGPSPPASRRTASRRAVTGPERDMRVLCVNTGSSSVKLRLLDADDALVGEHEAEAPGTDIDADALARALTELGDADAVVHRVVHGGDRDDAAMVDGVLIDELRGLTPLAPLHQPKALAAIEAVDRARPRLPAVACFDTAFHARMPPEAATYALPAQWRTRYCLRRFGFHGLSHAYVARRARELLGL